MSNDTKVTPAEVKAAVEQLTTTTRGAVDEMRERLDEIELRMNWQRLAGTFGGDGFTSSAERKKLNDALRTLRRTGPRRRAGSPCPWRVRSRTAGSPSFRTVQT